MGDANDPEVYTAAIIAVLADYSEEIARQVVDPRTGVPSKLKWLPTPKEIKDACEAIDSENRRRSKRDEGIARQLAERRDIEIRSATRRHVPLPSFQRANVFVPSSNKLYPEFVERSKGADTREFQYDAAGMWIADSWIRGAKWS